MKWIKIIFIAISLILTMMLASTVIGIVFSALWYLLLIGIVGIAGFGAYKFFGNKKDSRQLSGRNTPPEIEIESARRALEKYKRRLKLK